MDSRSECASTLITPAARRSEVDVQVVAPPEVAWFDRQLADQHYLGAGRAVGDYLRQLVTVRDQPAALLVWGPACYALKERDRWIGWSATQRVARLKLIVQNRRFLLLSAAGRAPNLASQTLAAAGRALPAQWQAAFGYRPLLAESFTDPEAYAGTCYQASNWEPLGLSAGYRRHRADFYVPTERPKRLWVHALEPQARHHLRAVSLPADCQPAVIAPPTGVLPVAQPQLLSLLAVLQHGPDPRAANTRFRRGPVLTLVALALLAGQRDLAAVTRFATTLSQKQRRQLGLPRQPTTQAFYQVPTYAVFSSVLARLDAEAFAAVLHAWLQAHAGTLPPALALDRETIRHGLDRLTRARPADGVPPVVALADQKTTAAPAVRPEHSERMPLNEVPAPRPSAPTGGRRLRPAP
jgi:hypothetical protein